MKIEITGVSVTKKGVVYVQGKVVCGMKKEDVKIGGILSGKVEEKEKVESEQDGKSE